MVTQGFYPIETDVKLTDKLCYQWLIISTTTLLCETVPSQYNMYWLKFILTTLVSVDLVLMKWQHLKKWIPVAFTHIQNLR